MCEKVYSGSIDASAAKAGCAGDVPVVAVAAGGAIPGVVAGVAGAAGTDRGKDLAVEVREYFIPDFSNWKDHDSFEAAFARLQNDLRAADAPLK